MTSHREAARPRGCGLRTSGQQVCSRHRSPPAREGPPPPRPPRLAPASSAPGRQHALRHEPPDSLASPGRQALRFLGAEAGPACRRLPAGLGGPAARPPAPWPPRARSPAPVCGSGAARAPPAARSSSSSSSGHAGGPGISPTARPGAGSRVAFRPSVRPPAAPASLTLPQRHRAGCSGAHGRFGQTSARLPVRTRRSGH